jgi:hypothetical protein
MKLASVAVDNYPNRRTLFRVGEGVVFVVFQDTLLSFFVAKDTVTKINSSRINTTCQ